MYTVVVLDEDEGEDDLWGEGGCIVVNDPSVYKLFISDEGYAVLKIGPFMDGYDGLPGINVTIHLKNNNISALTGTTGFAVFYITFPVIYDLYEVTTEYGGKTATSEIYLEVSVDGLKYLGYSTVSSEILEKGYEYLKIGPIVKNNNNPVPGVNVTIYLEDFNISAYTKNDGMATFNISFPIEYGLYNISAKHESETIWWKMYLVARKN